MARDRTGMRIQEAFMVRVASAMAARDRDRAIGPYRHADRDAGAFSYFNDDPANVRNVPECGGGGLLDIGCYFVMTSRWVFGREPRGWWR